MRTYVTGSAGQNSFILLILTVMLVAVTGSNCSIDHGLAPFPAKIEGSVIYQNPVPPSTDIIVAAVALKFPPDSLDQLVISSPLPKWSGDTVRYEIPLPYGTYPILAVVWKGKNQPLSISDVVAYHQMGILPIPAPVTLNEEKPVALIDLYADFTWVVRDALIKGRITYQGEWPSSTALIGLGAFTFVPKTASDLIVFKAAKIGIPIFVSHYDYSLAVSEGTYRYIGLFWLGKGGFLGDIRFLGFYPDPDAPDVPGEITIKKGETITGIDILVDFNQFNP